MRSLQVPPPGLVSLTAFEQCTFDDISASSCITEFKNLEGLPSLGGAPLYLVVSLLGAHKVGRTHSC